MCGVQVQRRGKFSALLSVVLRYHRPLPQPLWARNTHTHLDSLLLRALGETLPTAASRRRYSDTSKDAYVGSFSNSVFVSRRSWTETEVEVVALAVAVSGSSGCTHWITTAVWKTRTPLFPLARGPLSPSGAPYPGHLARATTPPTLSKPRPARAVPAPHPSILKVRRDRRAVWEVWD